MRFVVNYSALSTHSCINITLCARISVSPNLIWINCVCLVLLQSNEYSMHIKIFTCLAQGGGV